MNFIIVLAEHSYCNGVEETVINIEQIAYFYDADNATCIVLNNGNRIVTRSVIGKQLKEYLTKLGHKMTRIG